MSMSIIMGVGDSDCPLQGTINPHELVFGLYKVSPQSPFFSTDQKILN